MLDHASEGVALRDPVAFEEEERTLACDHHALPGLGVDGGEPARLDLGCDVASDVCDDLRDLDGGKVVELDAVESLESYHGFTLTPTKKGLKVLVPDSFFVGFVLF